jgi:hypothetical protein
MRTNAPNLRPLGSPTEVGDLNVNLRPGSLRCVGCGREFRQINVQPSDGGVRFICACGLEALEVVML